MGFLSKFTNWASSKAQGISNKVGNMWNKVKDTASNTYDKAKGVASKVWEGTKSAAKTVGKFVYDNSDAIAAGLGGIAAGVAASYGVDPGTILAVREAVGGVANVLPEGKIKSALLSAAWKQKESVPDNPKYDLSKIVPGGKDYASAVAVQARGPNQDGWVSHGSSGGEFKHISNVNQYYVPEATPPRVVKNVKKPSNKKKKH